MLVVATCSVLLSELSLPFPLATKPMPILLMISSDTLYDPAEAPNVSRPAVDFL